jgi:hypothetical protein
MINAAEHVSSDFPVFRLRDGNVVPDKQKLAILAFRRGLLRVCGKGSAQGDSGGTGPECLYELASVTFHNVSV